MEIETAKKENENEIISVKIIEIDQLYKIFGIIWFFVFCTAIWCACKFDIIKDIRGLDKTVFAFIAGIFISTLIFTDSIIKTYKYNTRAKESLGGNIMQTIALVAMGIWAYFNK